MTQFSHKIGFITQLQSLESFERWVDVFDFWNLQVMLAQQTQLLSATQTVMTNKSTTTQPAQSRCVLKWSTFKCGLCPTYPRAISSIQINTAFPGRASQGTASVLKYCLRLNSAGMDGMADRENKCMGVPICVNTPRRELPALRERTRGLIDFRKKTTITGNGPQGMLKIYWPITPANRHPR